jgi:hypothetical protein
MLVLLPSSPQITDESLRQAHRLLSDAQADLHSDLKRAADLDVREAEIEKRAAELESEYQAKLKVLEETQHYHIQLNEALNRRATELGEHIRELAERG